MMRPEELKQLTPEAMALLGAPGLAYIKPGVWQDQPVYAICAADGTQITIVSTREMAFIVARQHDLDPVSVH